MDDTTVIALLYGPDQPGLVARVSGWIFERGGDIHHADQHRDHEANVFFQRLQWACPGDARAEADAFADFASRQLGMEARTALARDRPKVALMVSRADHCFHDTILRFRAGELHGELVCVLSNHPDLREAAAGYGLPFHHVPVSKSAKADAEARQTAIIREAGADLVVLARYMQILSQDMLDRVGVPVINIHHSFLPAFAGGRPYHQAYRRGVKLIGATAHYATEDLDEGPIIHQDVARVSHRSSVPDLMRKGRDLEKTVLAHAVRLHLEQRILVYNHKTVVFD